MRVVDLFLPMPPSVNHMYWETPRGKIKTDEYRYFEEACGLILAQQEMPMLRGPIWIRFVFHFRTAAGDVDNRFKPAQDVLQGWLYNNDRQIVNIAGARGLKSDEPYMEVVAWEFDGSPDSFRPALDYIVRCAIGYSAMIDYNISPRSESKTAPSMRGLKRRQKEEANDDTP